MSQWCTVWRASVAALLVAAALLLMWILRWQSSALVGQRANEAVSMLHDLGKQHVVHVRVVDITSNEGIEGADVELHLDVDKDKRSRVTDESGGAVFMGIRPGHAEVVASVDGYIGYRMEVAIATDTTLRIAMQPLRADADTGSSVLGPVVVTVVDDGDVPVSGCNVFCSGQGNDFITAPTDESGQVVLERVESGVGMPIDRRGDLYIEARDEFSGFGSSVLHLDTLDADIVILRMRAITQVNGIVVDPDGLRVPHASVRVRTPEPYNVQFKHVWTDEDGEFSVGIGPGTWDIDVQAAGSGVARVRGVEVPTKDGERVVITVGLEMAIRGRVTGPGGHPVVGVKVGLVAEVGGIRSSSWNVSTDYDGWFSLFTLRDDCMHTITLSDSSQSARSLKYEAIRNVCPETEPYMINVDGIARNVSGVVRDIDGAGIDGAHIRYFRVGNESFNVSFGECLRSPGTDNGGSFDLYYVDADAIIVVGYSPDRGFAVSELLDVPTVGHVNEVVAQLRPGADIRIQVLDDRGRIVNDAGILIQGVDNPEVEVSSELDGQGGFFVRGLPLGRYKINVPHSLGTVNEVVNWDGDPRIHQLFLKQLR